MSVMSRLASAPPNLHQYVVFSAVRAAQDGTPPPRTLLMIAVATVILQCSVAVGVMFGAVLPACAKADQCSQGYYCDPTIGRCEFCGSRLAEFAPVQWSGPCVCESTGRPLEDNEESGVDYWEWACPTVPDPSCRTFHNPSDPNYDGANQTCVLEACAAPRKSFELRRGDFDEDAMMIFKQLCEHCVYAIDGSVDPTTDDSIAVDNIGAMGIFDYTATFLASVIISLTGIGEMRDIELCNIAIGEAEGVLPAVWKIGLVLIGVLRRWAFLPSLYSCIVALVMLGGEALSVCFNTIAVLFLCELE